MTLKTLKEFMQDQRHIWIRATPKPTHSKYVCDYYYLGYLKAIEEIEKELKAEAIKWVKNYECALNDIGALDNDEKMQHIGAEIALRHFFNITEEDLKDMKGGDEHDINNG